MGEKSRGNWVIPFCLKKESCNGDCDTCFKYSNWDGETCEPKEDKRKV